MKAIKSNVNQRHAVPDNPNLAQVELVDGKCYFLDDALADLLVELDRAELVDADCSDAQHGDMFDPDAVSESDEDEDENEDNEEPPKKPWQK